LRLLHLCFTEKIRPATLIAPLRAAPLAFALTEKVTVPLPAPLLFEVIVIQLTLLVAAQMHCGVADTLMVPLPPLAVND